MRQTSLACVWLGCIAASVSASVPTEQHIPEITETSVIPYDKSEEKARESAFPFRPESSDSGGNDATVETTSETVRLIGKFMRQLRNLQTLQTAETVLAQARERMVVGLAVRVSAQKVAELKHKVQTHVEQAKLQGDEASKAAGDHLNKLRDSIAEQTP